MKQLSSSKSDTEKVNLMNDFSVRSGNHSSTKSVDYALKAVDLAKKIHYTRGLLAAYEAAGDAYWYVYNYDMSVDYYLRELKLADSLNISSRKAKANYNIGWIKCVQQGMYSERGKLINALKVFERLHDTSSIIMVCNALSSVYHNHYVLTHEQLDSANFYFRGMVYLGENNASLKGGLVTIYGNYATFLIQNKRYTEAKKYILKSLILAKDQKDTFGYVSNRSILGLLYFKTDSIDKAKKIFEELVPIMVRKDYKPGIQDAYYTLFQISQKENDYKKALEYHLLYKEVNDTLNSIVFRSNLQEKETAYEIAKREENIRKLQQINEVSQLKNKQNKFVMAGMALVATLIIAFAFNLYKSNRNKQKANLLLSAQNKIIADKKGEIEQSIQYAKGIQNAVLPSTDEFKRALPGSFVIYLPKDVVSGDFYWMHMSSELEVRSSQKLGDGSLELGDGNSSVFGEQSSQKLGDGSLELGVGNSSVFGEQSSGREDLLGKITNYELQTSNSKLLIAAADCTGHGVPGSLMSIVSIDKLNQAVLGKKLISPSHILTSINSDIKSALKQESATNTQKDGLDIALLLYDPLSLTLTYSGANRPLWIVRDGDLMEFKATKTSIAGHTPLDQKFEETKVTLQKHDLVLIFSDGYADQFGGESGKKMMTRNFKDRLIQIASGQIAEIESSLINHFNAWKGQYEQVDDVLVIGFKI